MTDVRDEQRWGVYLVQAQNFAKRENYVEAVSRAGLVVDEAEAALAGATGEDRERVAEVLLRARKLQKAYQASLDAWNARIAARRAKVIEGAEAEMARPLPNPPPPARR